MKSTMLVLLGLVVTAGPALAQQPHPPHPPHPAGDHPHNCERNHPADHHGYGAGTYDLQFDMHGAQNTAVLRISCEEGKLVGKLEAHGQTIALEVVGMKDMQLTLSGGPEISLTLTFKNENQVTGKWTQSGNSGGVSGTRQKT